MTVPSVVVMTDAQRRRSIGKRRAIQKKSGADARHRYQISEPTPRLRRSCAVLAGGGRMRGSEPGGVAGMDEESPCATISVTTATAADTAATRQSRRSERSELDCIA